jgi:hypothetical protein
MTLFPVCMYYLDGGMSLLKHPSAAMTKLISYVEKIGAPGSESDRAIQRPVIAFIIQRHDLDGLQMAMRQALRKASCRVFAMQVGTGIRNVCTANPCHTKCVISWNYTMFEYANI